MSIRFRFTVTLTLLGLLLFGGYGIVDYLRESDDLNTSAEAEIRFVGRSLQVSLGNALRDRQRVDIDETLQSLSSLPPTMDIHVREVGGAVTQSNSAERNPELDAVMTRVTATDPESVTFKRGTVVYVAPLTGDHGEMLGVVAIERHTTDLEDDLSRTRWRLIVMVVAFVTVTSLIGALLGTAYITRPTKSVLAGIRDVREGNFQARVPRKARDEIGALVDEFNAMVADLEATRGRAEQATEAHLRIERGLQRVDKMITIGQLSAGLAHEIGSPLQVLRGRASTILEKTGDPEVKRQAQILVEQTDRISRIVEQLLSFGRRRPAAITACTLFAPVNTVIELLTGEAARRGVTLAIQAGNGDLAIEADEDQVQQVVLNLVRNALAVTPRGGTITVELEARGTEGVSLIVRDTGPGISDEMQARMFEPFFTTRASEGGTGLGLAVVHSIVVDHGGSIAVDSKLGAGARFAIVFPRRQNKGRVHA